MLVASSTEENLEWLGHCASEENMLGKTNFNGKIFIVALKVMTENSRSAEISMTCLITCQDHFLNLLVAIQNFQRKLCLICRTSPFSSM